MSRKGRKPNKVCPKCGGEIIEVTREAHFDYVKEKLTPAQKMRRCSACAWEYRVRDHTFKRRR